MKTILTVLLTLYIYATYAQTDISGSIGTSTWTVAGSPYNIIGTTTLSSGNTLTIDPGVVVNFNSHTYNLQIDGTLLAAGTTTDSIRFNGAIGGEIHLRSGSNSTLEYIRFTQLGVFNDAGLQISAAASVSHCYFDGCEVGISIQNNASPTIQNNTFLGSSDYGITVLSGEPLISDNIVDGNSTGSGGLLISGGSPVIENNLIQNNTVSPTTYAVTIDAVVIPTLENNTFNNNSRDLLTHPELINDTLYDDNGLTEIYISGQNITNTTTWHKPQLPEDWSYKLAGSITVDSGDTLTIEPGVEIDFTSSSLTNLFIDGVFLVEGTSSDSVRFNGATGGEIFLRSGSHSSFEYVRFSQLGAFNDAGLRIFSSSSSVTHCYFDQCEAGISVENNANPLIQNNTFFSSIDYGVNVQSGSPVISNNLIDGNSGSFGGIFIGGGSPVIETNLIQNHDASPTSYAVTIDAVLYPNLDNNSFNSNSRDLLTHPELINDSLYDNNGLTEIFISGHNITNTTTWHKPPLTEDWNYKLAGSITVESGDTLTIEPGVTIDFTSPTLTNIFIDGTFLAVGTSSDSIRFNGAIGGEIFLRVGSNSTLQYVSFDRLGSINDAGLQISSSTCSISNCTFEQCEVGISVHNDSDPVIDSVRFSNSNHYGMRVFSGSPGITYSCFHGNPYGILNEGGGIVNAINNWWGDTSGAYHLSTNTSGTGEEVSDGVLYDPWMVVDPCIIYAVSITSQPSAVELCEGDSDQFSVTTEGTTGITYQWQVYDGSVFTDIADDEFYSGSSTSSLTISNAPSTISGFTYRCYMSGDYADDVISDTVSILVNSLPTAPDVTDELSCQMGSVNLVASGASDGNYRWYESETGGAAISGEVNAAYATPSLTATTSYYVSIQDGNCESDRTEIVAIINEVVPPVATDTSACLGDIAILIASGATNGQYRWYTAETGGSPVTDEYDSIYAVDGLTSTSNFFVSIHDGLCESERTQVTATINEVAPPGATDGTICLGDHATLIAKGATSGAYRWYTTDTGGSPISGETDSIYTTPALTATTSYFVSINEGTCESERTEVTAAVNLLNSPSVTDATGCTGQTVTLNASGATNGQYRWYSAETGGSPIPGEYDSTLSISGLTTDTAYYVSVNDGTCESERVPVSVFMITAEPPTGADIDFCLGDSVNLVASGSVNGNYRWYDQETGGNPLPEAYDSIFPTIASSDITYYVSTINGSCESARTALSAYAVSVTAPLAANFNSCAGEATTIYTSGGMNGDFRWYSTAVGGDSFPESQDSVFITPALNSSTSYYVSLINGSCESGRAEIQINIPEQVFITSQPGSQTVEEGENSLFEVQATGGNLNYQWQKDGLDLSGETGSQLMITNAMMSDSGGYHCVIYNTCDTLTTDMATLHVIHSAIDYAVIDFENNNELASDGLDTVDFGQAAMLSSLFWDFEIENRGTQDLIISEITSSDPTFSISNVPNEPIPPTQSASFTIDILAESAGSITSQITILGSNVNFQFFVKAEVVPTNENSPPPIIVYNAVAPDGDGNHDFLKIENIEYYENNMVYIYNRWGTKVFERSSYDNSEATKRFNGQGDNGRLEGGTYYYIIELNNGAKPKSGYLFLKR